MSRRAKNINDSLPLSRSLPLRKQGQSNFFPPTFRRGREGERGAPSLGQSLFGKWAEKSLTGPVSKWAEVYAEIG